MNPNMNPFDPIFGDDAADVSGMSFDHFQNKQFFDDAWRQRTQTPQVVGPNQNLAVTTQPTHLPSAEPQFPESAIRSTLATPNVSLSATAGQGQNPFPPKMPRTQPGNAYGPNTHIPGPQQQWAQQQNLYNQAANAYDPNTYISGPQRQQAQQVFVQPRSIPQNLPRPSGNAFNPFDPPLPPAPQVFTLSQPAPEATGSQPINPQTLNPQTLNPQTLNPQTLNQAPANPIGLGIQQPQNLNQETANPTAPTSSQEPRFVARPWNQAPAAKYHVFCECCKQDLALSHDDRFAEPIISTQDPQAPRKGGLRRPNRKRAAVEEPENGKGARPKKRSRPAQNVIETSMKVMTQRAVTKLQKEGLQEPDNHPSKVYGDEIDIPENWGPREGAHHLFRYRETGHLEDRAFSAAQLKTFILDNPRDLTLWIQNFPAQSSWRFPDGRPGHCLWERCPVKDGQLKAGWLTVGFDEFPDETSTGARDPFAMAGMMHLWCFEHCFDVGGCTMNEYLKPDTRRLPREDKNPMSLAREYREAAVVHQILRPWFAKHTLGPDDAPRQGALAHEDSLSHALVKFHLRKQPKTRQAIRDKSTSANKMTLDIHMGDLMMFAQGKDCASRPEDEVLELDNAFQVVSNELRPRPAWQPATPAPAPQIQPQVPSGYPGYFTSQELREREAQDAADEQARAQAQAQAQAQAYPFNQPQNYLSNRPQDYLVNQPIYQQPMRPSMGDAPQATNGQAVAQGVDVRDMARLWDANNYAGGESLNAPGQAEQQPAMQNDGNQDAPAQTNYLEDYDWHQHWDEIGADGMDFNFDDQPSEPAQTEPTPAPAAPVQPAPALPVQAQPVSSQPALALPVQTQPALALPGQPLPAPAQPTPALPAPVQPALVNPMPPQSVRDTLSPVPTALVPIQNDPADNMPASERLPSPNCITVDPAIHGGLFSDDDDSELSDVPDDPPSPPAHLLKKNVKVTSVPGYMAHEATTAAKRKRDEDEREAKEARERAKRQRMPPPPTRTSSRVTRRSQPMVHQPLPRRPSQA